MAYGPATPLVCELAAANIARRPLAAARQRAPATVPAPSVQETPARPMLEMHAADRRKRLKHDDAICFFMDKWPSEWIAGMLGTPEQAARTSRRAAAVALEEHLRHKGGSDGATLRGAVHVIFGEHGYVNYRRHYNEPACWDFPISGAELVAFCAHRQATSAATARGGGNSVRHGVMASIKSAATYYKLPVDMDCVLQQAAAPRVAKEEVPADSVPTALLLGLEQIAAGGALHAVGTDYARAFLLLIALRARLGDMLSARAFAVAQLYSSTCVSCTMDMKDGSRQAWAAVPACGLTGEWAWAPEFVATRQRVGCVFVEFKCPRGYAGDIAHAEACAQPAAASKPRVERAWDTLIHYVALRQGFQLSALRQLRLTGHAPRHVYPTWAAKLNWSLPAREEIGRWAGDIVLLIGEERDTRQRSQRAICAVRYAREASRQTQVRLMRDLIDAVASIVGCEGDEWDAIVASPYYKMH